MGTYVERAGQAARWFVLLLFLSVAARADSIQLVSTFDRPAPAGGSGDSFLPVFSADGQFVLFASAANNLVLGGNGQPIPLLVPARLNAYLRDRVAQTTTLVSIATNGLAGGDGDSFPLALSTNRQFVLFESAAANLVVGDTNQASDIFLRDLVGGQTILVSVGTNGNPANGVSRTPVMTPDGRFVAFVSEASNLVPNDSNKIADVFVRDLQTLTTTRLSVGAVSTNPAPPFPVGSSESPEISADGRYVAFFSTATNLVPGVDTAGDIYVHDRVAGSNIWVSIGMRAQLQAVTGKTNGLCSNLALSGDGKFVAYQARVNPLGVGTNTGIILRYGLETGVTDLVHTNAATSVPVPEETRNLDLSADGGLLVFVANSNGLQATTTAVQVWNAASGVTTLVSGNLSGQVTAGSLSTSPSLDGSGRFVAFRSSATDLVTNALVGLWHVYVRDLLTGTTALVNADHNGAGTGVATATVPAISADGRLVAFESADGGLVANDHNRFHDVFVRDLGAGTNELISARHPALGSASPNSASSMTIFSASDDGRYVAFASDVDDPALGDTNGYRDVYVRDLAGNSNVLVSCDTAGVAGNGYSSEPAISGNGRFVAFTSSATNLVNGDTNRMTDVFVRDLQTGLTLLASAKPTGGSANSNAYAPTLSTDGRWLIFQSTATDLVSGPFSGQPNLYQRDLQSATTVALTTQLAAAVMTPDGRFVAFIGDIPGVTLWHLYVWDSNLGGRIYTNFHTGNYHIGISADGRFVTHSSGGVRIIDLVAQTNGSIPAVFQVHNPRFSGDGRWLAYVSRVPGSNQVILYDVQNRIETLVSHAANSAAGGAGHSEAAEISSDGRFVVYRTQATNIIAGANGIARQLILYDRLTGQNTLVSASRFTGLPGDDHSLRARFSADGQTLLLQSWASDLTVNDFNSSGDVFAQTIFTTVILPSTTVGEAPWLYWPSLGGNNYAVQYKTALSDSTWLPASGIMTNLANKVWFQDDAATNSQRFYRVESY